MRATGLVLLSVLTAGFSVGAGVAPALSADGAQTVPITGVVELFTSQGCSSCPPADKLLELYSQTNGVLALSFNVDYWDNLGWKDTLASPKYSQRQRAYARSRGDGQVYTPQAVVNGRTHAVGSDRSSIDQALHASSIRGDYLAKHFKVSREGGSAEVTLPKEQATAGSPGMRATVWLIKFTPRVEVAISRGENSGRSIAYHNVVRELTDVGRWTGEPQDLRVPEAALGGCTPGTCAILLQRDGTGPILAAAWVPTPGGS